MFLLVLRVYDILYSHAAKLEVIAGETGRDLHVKMGERKIQQSMSEWGKTKKMKTISPRLKAKVGQPPWDIARLYPLQGAWSEAEYLALNGNQMVEFTDGVVEVLPIPTTLHQRIVAFLYSALNAFVEARNLGEVLFSPLPVRLRQGKYREPDVVFMRTQHAKRIRDKYWQRPDLVMEVVSDDAESRDRDTRVKKAEYLRARIPEYWIIDPRNQQIQVLYLKGRRYVRAVEAGRGEKAASVLLKGFEVEVDQVFKKKND